MAPLSNHVSLTITQDSVGISRAGFGVPLFLSGTASFAERSREYSSLLEVTDDFPVTTSAEYLAARAIFSQSPRPPKMRIGRSALPATVVYTLVPNVVNLTAYTLHIKGDGVTSTTCTYTSDASATATEICDGLRTLINAVVGNNYLATGTTTLIITGDVAGDWFSVEVADVTLWADAGQTHVDPGVATDLAAIALENDDWYCLLTAYNSNAYTLAAAAWIETQKKIYLPDISETDAVTTSVGNSDTLDDLASLGYARTAGVYHPAPDQMNAAAWAGRTLPLDPGSETWKFKSLSGVVTTSLTSTQRANLIARKANFLETVAGFKMMSEGTTSDGDFIDVTRGLDWLEDDMSKGVFGALAGADKIPFTDDGIAVIRAQVSASLRRATSRGILSNNPAFTVTAPLAAEVSTADKAARLLADVKFSATLAGAIHKVTILGVVSV